VLTQQIQEQREHIATLEYRLRTIDREIEALNEDGFIVDDLASDYDPDEKTDERKNNHLKKEFVNLYAELKDKKDCVVCFEPIDAANLVVLDCGHYHCKTCTDEVVSQSGKCPQCRKKIKLHDDDDDEDDLPSSESEYQSSSNEDDEEDEEDDDDDDDDDDDIPVGLVIDPSNKPDWAQYVGKKKN